MATRSKTVRKVTKKASKKKASGKKSTAKSATKKATAKKSSSNKASKSSAKKSAGGKKTTAKPKAATPSKSKSPRKLKFKTQAAPKAQLSNVDPDVLEFIDAIDKYKQAHTRPFPTWSEVLHILHHLGYKRG